MLIGAPVPGTKKVGDRCRRTGEHKRSGENANEGARWEGHLLTSECAPEGAEGMGVGSGRQRSPTPLVLGHRGPDQLRCPAAGRISTPPHRAGGNRTTVASAPSGTYPMSPGKREEGVTGQGAPLRGAKYLGRPAWRPLSPGSPGAAAGRGWPAWGRKWVQEGQGQDSEVRPLPTMHSPRPFQGKGRAEGLPVTGGCTLQGSCFGFGFRGKTSSAGGAKHSTVPPAISYQ